MARQVAPDLPIHGSTQMTVHSLDGVLACAALGMERVVLSRELSRQQIAFICRRSPIEIEVFVHGALCMCYSGQCFLSSAIGGRSGNRGMCAQPCRMMYGWGGDADSYPLSLKDMSLVHHLQELEEMGVASAKIEGRMKRPEYVAIVTRVYADALREGRQPAQKELDDLTAAFNRQGFTDGYYMGRTGPEMFGVREKEQVPERLFAQTRQACRREHQWIPVRFSLEVKTGRPLRLQVEDDLGNQVTAEGPVPQQAVQHAATDEELRRQLERTGGTPYFADEIETSVDPGLAVSLSAANGLRRRVLDDLNVLRIRPPERTTNQFTPSPRQKGREEAPVFTVSLRKGAQLTRGLLELEPQVIYLSPEEILNSRAMVENAMERSVEVCAALPRICWDSERGKLTRQLEQVREMGITTALVGELGALTLALNLDFAPPGGFRSWRLQWGDAGAVQ
ncbi:MAG: U32 family peptidase [Clostridiales bacterium]|nr:U32 family peptidase [Clostridiales bacterium]